MTTLKTKHSLKIAWATHESIKFACQNWHYSKSVPVPPIVKIGVWEDEIFIGCVLFSRGASPSLFKPYGIKQTEGCELTRIALNKHKATVSKIMMLAIKFLKIKCPELKLIISFADPSEGHYGGVYQATNWIYTGKSGKSFKYVDKNGREWHSRQVSEKGYNTQQGSIRKTVRPSECKKIECEGKHRYLMPLCKNFEVKIKYLSQKYPKRVELESKATSFQLVESGAIPTNALHLD